ncbi:hypothetical protein [Nocardioides sp. Arc9.136]|uniref:TraR/DksA family transcriptional regulator n=1 Tax=Nocardioides sp. Arc9.136 TaxID=2996826 RepID=UPI00266631A7|nr:hypothetical protein [Nocardioides sp. Arc9.136]WKN48095.1 hypothetical protein OSR43_18910 [Nocardioides sp. Arc9.136]
MRARTVSSHRELLAQLRSELLRAAHVRSRQLADLSPSGGDETPVRAAHRGSVRRILRDIHDALDRMDVGTYGDCVACGRLVALLDLRRCPWVRVCGDCSRSTV